MRACGLLGRLNKQTTQSMKNWGSTTADKLYHPNKATLKDAVVSLADSVREWLFHNGWASVTTIIVVLGNTTA
jgi:hypothetical protein